MMFTDTSSPVTCRTSPGNGTISRGARSNFCYSHSGSYSMAIEYPERRPIACHATSLPIRQQHPTIERDRRTTRLRVRRDTLEPTHRGIACQHVTALCQIYAWWRVVASTMSAHTYTPARHLRTDGEDAAQRRMGAGVLSVCGVYQITSVSQAYRGNDIMWLLVVDI